MNMEMTLLGITREGARPESGRCSSSGGRGGGRKFFALRAVESGDAGGAQEIPPREVRELAEVEVCLEVDHQDEHTSQDERDTIACHVNSV